MTSVNTNAAALTALRTLQATNQQLESTQSRISTGLKIGEAKDNAAYWAISTTLKSDNKALSTVKDALGLGASTVDTAYQGLNKAKDVLDEIKSKLTAATQDGVDRSKIQSEITELQKQLVSIASASTFSGENWLSVNSAAAGYTASKSIVSGFTRSPDGSVSISSIGVDTTNVSLFNSDTTRTTRGILDTASTLSKSDGTALEFGGAFLGNLSSGGLKAVNQGVTSTVTVSAAAFTGASTVTFNNADDKFTFTIAVDGAAAQTVTVTKAMADAVNTENGDAPGTAITAGPLFAKLLQKGLSAAGISVTAGYDATATKLTYTSTTKGPDANIVVTAGVASDGGGGGTALANSQVAEIATSVATTNADRAFTKAKATMDAFTAPIKLDADDKITFQLTNDSNGANVRVITIDKTAINTATGRTDGTINNAAEYAAAITTALASPKNIDGTTATTVAANYTVSSTGNQVTIESKITTKLSNVTVGTISVSTGATGTADKLSLSDINITDATLKQRGAIDANGLLDATKVKQALQAYISVVNQAIEKVTSAASSLGAVASRVDMQTTFVNTLMDTIDKGVGRLVDADMSEESTKLQALQVKQQLGVQALSIANQSAQSVLSLFRS